jgi:hypothetical protein
LGPLVFFLQAFTFFFYPFGFLAARLCLSCLGPLDVLLPDFSYPVYVLWLTKGPIQDS